MASLWLACCAAGIAGIAAALGSAAPIEPVSVPADDAMDLARQVRAVLANNCFKCHGPDPRARRADLRLDTPDGPLEPFPEGGAPVVPGDPDGSEVIRRVTSADPEVRMPPVATSRDGLTPAQVELLRRWIEAGAPWTDHWSFEGPVRRDPPRVSDDAWCRQPLDRWVLARLDREGLRPSPEAERATLLRRVSIDLTGLPPSPAELDVFLADASPDAYERAVDRLLASPRFGERWARWWLDLARYADTKGYEKDERRSMWPYRDWLIRAFNDDMPFDRFTEEQLAGDLLPDPAPDVLIATAFHRNTMTNDEGGTDDEEFRTAAVIDRVNTTMEVWQGLTMACAQCHTHKYDPILHTDYYRTFAILNNTEDADRADEAPTLRIAPEAVERELSGVESELRTLETEPQPPAPDVQTAIDSLQKRRDALAAGVVHLPIMRELPGEKRRTTRRFLRGSFLSPAESVEPGIPEFLAGDPPNQPTNRLEFARWLMDSRNPLTARVIANRIWEQTFGTGLVETVEDFGVQGAPPSDPDLLDHIAIEFRDGGWSIKALLRTLVTSSTYRQSSRVTPDLLARDPSNRLLARGARFRLDGETIRDQSLAAAGLLSSRMYGPPVFPPQPDGLWIMIYSGDRWTNSAGDARYRRAIYTFWRRTVPYPSMTTFDAPSREFCVSRRIRTNTPLQAFVTLNDPAFVECAQAMARRVLRESGPDDAPRIDHAFRLAVCRAPSPAEVEEVAGLLADERARFRSDADSAARAATAPLGPAPEGADVADLAAWSVACGVLLNLDEALTRE